MKCKCKEKCKCKKPIETTFDRPYIPYGYKGKRTDLLQDIDYVENIVPPKDNTNSNK